VEMAIVALGALAVWIVYRLIMTKRTHDSARELLRSARRQGVAVNPGIMKSLDLDDPENDRQWEERDPGPSDLFRQ
jgi:hypothetical protein